MESVKLLEADYLDIIFENRNKVYGGYDLRRTYNRRVKKAGIVVFTVLGSLICFSFISAPPEKITAGIAKPLVTTVVDLTPKKIEQPKPKQIEPPKAVPTPPETKVFTPPKIEPDKEIVDPAATADDMKHATPGLSNTKGDSTSDGVVTKTPGISGPVVPPPTNKIEIFAEEMPVFQGNVNEYISKHLIYPQQARDAGIDGRVAIQFVVNEDGSITDARVMKGIGGGCDEEALRVIRSMPKWKPGKNAGRVVKVMLVQPITFRLQ